MSKRVSQPVTVRISTATVEQLDQLATVTDRSRAWHVEQALDAYLDLQRWQLQHIRKGLEQLAHGEGIPQEDVEAYLETWGTPEDDRQRR